MQPYGCSVCKGLVFYDKNYGIFLTHAKRSHGWLSMDLGSFLYTIEHISLVFMGLLCTNGWVLNGIDGI